MNKKRVLALVDGDIVAFSHAAAEEYGKELEDVNFAKIQMSMDSKMKHLLSRVGATEHITLLTGSINMRDDFADDYKANRDGTWRPANLKNAKAHLQVAWEGIYMDGLEADDLMACFARHKYELVMGKRGKILEMHRVGPCDFDEVVIISLDKDLRQVSQFGGVGPVIKHYQWEREGQGIGEKMTTVKDFGELKLILKASGKTTKKEVKGNGPKFFLWQMLTGDSTDGIMGCGVRELRVYKTGAKAGQEYYKRDGIGAVEAYEILEHITDYQSGLQKVIGAYIARFGDGWEEKLLATGRMLYMQHHIDDGVNIRLWHYNGAIIDRYNLKEKRIIPHIEYLHK